MGIISRIGKAMVGALMYGVEERTPPHLLTQNRAYAGAQVNRLTSDWLSIGTSADSEIIVSLRLLRARSRELHRDHPNVKHFQGLVRDNVIGGEIGIQSAVMKGAKLDSRLNAQIKEALEEWMEAKNCDVSGHNHFHDLMRLAVGSWEENGEVIFRRVKQKFGDSQIPFALQLIESDQLMDQWQMARAPNGNSIRMGVEIDEWQRPVAYWLWPIHPGDYQFQSFVPSKFLRIPADEIIHIYIKDRVGQTRGVPWIHAALTRLNHMKGYEEAEIIAARAAACIHGFITSPEAPPVDMVEGNQRQITMEPLAVEHLLPGESYEFANPSRPNGAMEPFMRFMLRQVACATGISYESFSNDYSATNYSSSRLGQFAERDMWRVLQRYIIRKFYIEVYREWLDLAVLSGAVKIPDYYANKKAYQKVKFRPRGWGMTDPAKDVPAYIQAVRAGFMTIADVKAETAGSGVDLVESWHHRAEEIKLANELGLIFDTDPKLTDKKGSDSKQTDGDTVDNA
jgi:lambda family phage portal protein